MEKALFDRDFANWCGNVFDDLCKFNPSKEDIQRLNVRNIPQQKSSVDLDKELGDIYKPLGDIIDDFFKK